MAGIYLHIPYCKKACHYCDFHFSTSQGSRSELIAAMLSELDFRKDYLQQEPVESIYFGGGTPSLLKEAELGDLLEKIHANFTVVPGAEITLEANPDDLDTDKLSMLGKSAVNRLSIGIQSFFQEDLVWMNRAHSASEAQISVKKAQEAGFHNISIDLIYGYPLLTDLKWASNIRTAVDLNIQHLSCYSMTVEPLTALDSFIKKGKTAAMNEEQSALQFTHLMRELTDNGINQYEISNFSRPGFQARHNSNYWNGRNYLGIGPSAHSFNQTSRESNIADNRRYISMLQSDRSAQKMYELLSPVNQLNELIMTSLRTNAGLDLDLVEDRFGSGERMVLLRSAQTYQQRGWIIEPVNSFLALTAEGRKFCDLITSELFREE